MNVKYYYALFYTDFHDPPTKIVFNTEIMREATIPLGKDDTLRIFCDKDSLDKFNISVQVDEAKSNVNKI